MKIEQCAYFSKENLTGNPSCGTCNIFTQEELLRRRYIPCEAVPISKCPYKMFKEGLITKEELNNEVKKLVAEQECSKRCELEQQLKEANEVLKQVADTRNFQYGHKFAQSYIKKWGVK